MGEEIKATKELEGIRQEAEKLVDHLDALEGNSIEVENVASIITALVEGGTAASIISDFDLVSDDEDEPGV